MSNRFSELLDSPMYRNSSEKWVIQTEEDADTLRLALRVCDALSRPPSAESVARMDMATNFTLGDDLVIAWFGVVKEELLKEASDV